MNLDKDNVKKIRGLILFTVFVLVALWNYELVFDGVVLLWKVIFPFVLGGAIAFLVNIPMNFFERKIFGKAKKKEKNWVVKLARPCSLILTLLTIIGVIAVVMLVVIPELGRTILNLGKTVQDFVPQAQAWAIQAFHEHEEIVDEIAKIDFKWDEILENGINFLKNGAGSVIGTTFEAAKGIVSGMTTFFISFVFACYVLLRKEKLGVHVKKLMCAFMPDDR